MKPPEGTPEELWYLRGFEAAVLQLRADERAAIVAWLCDKWPPHSPEYEAGRAIERGEHLGER